MVTTTPNPNVDDGRSKLGNIHRKDGGKLGKKKRIVKA